MKKTVEELTQEDFKINKFEFKNYDKNQFWIITKNLKDSTLGSYLHRDGSVKDTCGDKNFYKSEEEAQEYLDKYYPIKSKGMTIGEQIKFAKALIGKRIKHRNNCGASTIDGYEVITELDNKLRTYSYLVEDSKEIFSKQDVLIYIYGNENTFKRAISPKSTESDFKIVEEW